MPRYQLFRILSRNCSYSTKLSQHFRWHCWQCYKVKHFLTNSSPSNCANSSRFSHHQQLRYMNTMEGGTEPVIIACVQMTCTEDKSQNFELAKGFIRDAKERQAKMVFLPEAFDYIGRTKEESAQLSETIDGPLISSYRDLAQELNLWLSLGGFHEKQPEMREGDIPWMTNNHILIDPLGQIKSVYRKVHLFDVVIPEEKVFLQESSFVRAGQQIVEPVDTPIGKLGLGICYDLRFPQFSLSLRDLGADIITYPSAFTVPTGEAHWESLLRARAIETQCFVVAAAQTGSHNVKRSSYGHSVIIDPWGKVLANAGTSAGVITAEIDLCQIPSIRKKMPVIEHQRHDLYKTQVGTRIQSFNVPEGTKDEETFPFGHVNVKYSGVFLENANARGFVNKKCVLNGHVLVSTKRVAKRIQDLTPVELADLFSLVQKVQIVMESLHGATSSTVVVQDGKDAGQTIEHVHVHVTPRKPNDFEENDEIYERLEKHDKGEKVEWRTEDEMTLECQQIRKHIEEKLMSIMN